MSNSTELISNSNGLNKWIEEAISKNFFKYYEFEQFYNIQEIGSGGFGKVYRANWKNSLKRYAIKTFFNINDATVKAIVREIQLQREVDFHDNVIRFYGVTTSIKENQRKEYSLVIEYAENGTLRKYLKENFKNLSWDNKFDLAFQLVYAVSCLHDEGIMHRDLHSNNVLVHQNTVKLADFGLSKRIEEISNSQSKTFGLIPYADPKRFDRSTTEFYLLNKKSDVYSIGVLLWEISSCQPPFHGKPYDVGLAISILQGLRETPIRDTPEEYIKIYTDCWNIEPDNRPTINQVVDEFKVLITKENIIIKDFHLYNDTNNVQSSNNHQLPNLNISESTNSLHGELSQVIHNFDMMNTKDIESSISSTNNFEDNFNIIQKVLSYLNEQNITLREINNLLLNNQNNSNSIYLIGKFNDLGIGISVNVQKAFELYQKAADLGNVFGINDLGYCYQYGIGTDIDEKKAFELFQKVADLGSSSGINNLGACYEQGIGTDIDEKKAFELYQKAANLGYSSGINNLGACYKQGIGTDIDEKKAFELYQKAADLGNSSGINNLGACYENGIGTDIDKKKAFELYQKAAELGNSSGINNLGASFELYQKAADLGNSSAQYNLAIMYENGEVTVKNIDKAIYWYKKSAGQGDQDAQNKLEKLKNREI
ncbi:kinase-like protein [Rhizophagus irregularis]|uniref:Kinase-like protein n=1 Tax=Rhizophagus irregularis TaxID=588596 RepID=A0A2N1MKN3_9GLOM|nr:kinase-like protein [Rhizophagus irregularis]